MLRKGALLLAALAVLAISGCAAKPGVSQNDIDALAQGIMAFGPEVDPQEARRAAHIAYTYSAQLAKEYNVTDPPIVHNYKVINGYRERGLCVDWAEDLEKRLKQENFRTLSILRATAPPKNAFRISHSTAVVAKRGDTYAEGIVLDPWRYGGVLFWSPTREDKSYIWQSQLKALEAKQRASEAALLAGMQS